MTASLHPFRPLSAPVTVSARLDARKKKKCGWLDRSGVTGHVHINTAYFLLLLFLHYCKG